MLRKTIVIIVFTILLCQIFSIFNEATAQAQDRSKKAESLWARLWKWLKDHTFLFSIITVTFITIVSTVMTMLKRDKILKSLAGHLITIEIKGGQPDSDGSRYRGRLRVESEGLEVVEEKVDTKDEKISYLIRKDEFSTIHALLRYHDLLTDKEKNEREEEVRRVYHPSIGMRLRRRVRNVINEMRRIATEAFKLIFGKVQEQFGRYKTELEEKGTEVVTYITGATYDALIDRLIGTRIVIRVKDNLEYVGVLKDYTSDFIELLNVEYKNTWQTTLKRDDGFSKNERGLYFTRDENDIVILSKGPFPVKLRHIFWREDKPDAERKDINAIIEPFGELRISVAASLNMVVNPFDKLEIPTKYPPQAYKKLLINFESVRVADVVLLKNYGLVRHRTEKFDANRILDFNSLADALLANKEEKLMVEGNPSTTSLTIYNGYLTNLPMERMDYTAVDQQCHQRWTMRNFFDSLDKRLRPISRNHFLGLKARKAFSLIALAVTLSSDKNQKNNPLLPTIYYALCKFSTKKCRQIHKKQVLIKKRKRLFGFIPKSTST